MKTTYKLYTDNFYMKNTYLMKKDKYGMEIFVIVNGVNLLIAKTFDNKINFKHTTNFIKSISNFIQINENKVEFEYDIYMTSLSRENFLNEVDGYYAINKFRFQEQDTGLTVGVSYKQDVNFITWAA
jgi:hypothetical protein